MLPIRIEPDSLTSEISDAILPAVALSANASFISALVSVATHFSTVIDGIRYCYDRVHLQNSDKACAGSLQYFPIVLYNLEDLGAS